MKATLRFRYSDNSSWTVVDAEFSGNVVKRVSVVNQGVYRVELVGKSVRELAEMTRDDPTGRHPEQYFEVWHPGFNRYLSFQHENQLPTRESTKGIVGDRMTVRKRVSKVVAGGKVKFFADFFINIGGYQTKIGGCVSDSPKQVEAVRVQFVKDIITVGREAQQEWESICDRADVPHCPTCDSDDVAAKQPYSDHNGMWECSTCGDEFDEPFYRES